jgi:hypothetical protein
MVHLRARPSDPGPSPSLLLAGLPFSQQAQAQSEAGWIVLFDGKSLDNWNQIGDANWRIEDGAAVADKGNGFLVSKNAYGDFQLRVPVTCAKIYRAMNGPGKGRIGAFSHQAKSMAIGNAILDTLPD